MNEGLLANEDSSYAVMFGNFGDCAGWI